MEKAIYKTALDIGSSSIKAIIGELSENGEKIKIIASSQVKSQGIKKSKVEDAEKASQCIKDVIEKLSEASGVKIEEVSIAVGGSHIESDTKSVKHHFNVEGTEVEKSHYKLLYEAAKEKVDKNRTILKRELYNLRVNDSGIVKNPIGMKANYLSGDVNLITVDTSELELLLETVNKANLRVEEVTLNAYASAKATLKKDDKKMGVALVDIGEGSTDLIIFKSDKLIYCKSISIGGMHYINDLAYIKSISKEEASSVINKYQTTDDEIIEIIWDDKKVEYEAQEIRDIFNARSEDIAKYILKSIQESGFNGYLGNGIILTGGATNIKGLEAEMSRTLKHRMKVENPTKIRGFDNGDPSFSTVLGVLLEALEKEHQKILGSAEEEAKTQDVKTEEKNIGVEKKVKDQIPVTEIPSMKVQEKKVKKQVQEKKEKKEGLFEKAKNLLGELF